MPRANLRRRAALPSAPRPAPTYPAPTHARYATHHRRSGLKGKCFTCKPVSPLARALP